MLLQLLCLFFNFYSRGYSVLHTTITLLEYSEFDYIFTFTTEFYSFVCFSLLVPFYFSLKSSPRLLFVTECLYFFFFFDRQFCHVLYSWFTVFSSFSILNISLSHSLFAYEVSTEKSADGLMGFHFGWSLFSCCFQSSFCLIFKVWL